MAKDKDKKTEKEPKKEKSEPKPKSSSKSDSKKPSPKYTWKKIKTLFEKVQEGTKRANDFVRKTEGDKENSHKYLRKEIEEYSSVDSKLLDTITDIIKENKDNPDALRQTGVDFLKDLYARYNLQFSEGMDSYLEDILKTAPEKIWKVLVESVEKGQVEAYIKKSKKDSGLAKTHLDYVERKDVLRKYQESRGQDKDSKKAINNEFDSRYKPEYEKHKQEYKVLRNLAEALGAPISDYNKKTKEVRQTVYDGVKDNMSYAIDVAGKEHAQSVVQQGLEGKLDKIELEDN